MPAITSSDVSRRLSADVAPGLASVTPLILTFNEAANIERTLAALSWAGSIVVVDSGSTDGTLEILARNPAVTVVHRAFDNHTAQWNHGLDQIATNWVLTLDADYVVSAGFAREMQERIARSDTDGYFANFIYCIDGKPLRATLYTPRLVLFRTSAGRYEADGHTQRLRLTGRSESMTSVIHHDDRKPLSRWLEAQQRYAVLEAAKLRDSRAPLSLRGRLRKSFVFTPVLVFAYCLIWRGLIFDGIPGLKYALQRLYAETLISLYLREQ